MYEGWGATLCFIELPAAAGGSRDCSRILACPSRVLTSPIKHAFSPRIDEIYMFSGAFSCETCRETGRRGEGCFFRVRCFHKVDRHHWVPWELPVSYSPSSVSYHQVCVLCTKQRRLPPTRNRLCSRLVRHV